MNNYLLLMRWLAVASLIDWLLVRTVTRVAIFIPMPPTPAAIFRLLDNVGQVAISLAGVLVLVVLGIIARDEWRQRRILSVAPALVGLMALSLLFLVVPPAGWPALTCHLLYLMLVTLLVLRAAPWQGEGVHLSAAEWAALLLPALAIVAGRLHQALPTLYATMHWPGPAPLTELFFNMGELFVILSALALWWAYGRAAPRWAWLAAALPTLAFMTLYLTNPHATGMLAIWSNGLTLYLPWPLYAAAIWLACVTLAAPHVMSDGIGWAILLMAAGGYAPQLSVQAFLGLIALYLLTGALRRETVKYVPEPCTSPQPVNLALPSTTRSTEANHASTAGIDLTWAGDATYAAHAAIVERKAQAILDPPRPA